MTAEQLEELLADAAGRRMLKHIATSLARRVIAAEKLVEAYERYHSVHPLRIGKVEKEVNKALAAYREASK